MMFRHCCEIIGCIVLVVFVVEFVILAGVLIREAWLWRKRNRTWPPVPEIHCEVSAFDAACEAEELERWLTLQ